MTSSLSGIYIASAKGLAADILSARFTDLDFDVSLISDGPTKLDDRFKALNLSLDDRVEVLGADLWEG